MKTGILYTFLLLLTFSIGFPQEVTGNEKLLSELSEAKSDTAKIRILDQLAGGIWSKDFAKAKEYNLKAYELAVRIKRTDLQIELTNSLADYYWYRGDYDLGFKYYYNAYRMGDSINDKPNIALSLYNLGWIACVQQKNYNDINYLYRSLKISEEIHDDVAKMKVCNALGSFFGVYFEDNRERKYFDSAVKYFEIGLKTGRATKRFKNIGSFLVGLGDLQYSVKDYKTSKFYMEEARRIYLDKGDSTNLMLINFKIAISDYELGEQKKAYAMFEKCLAFFTQRDFQEMHQMILHSLAKANFDAGDYKKAYLYFEQYSSEKDKADKKAYATTLSSMENKNSLEKAEINVNKLKQDNEIQELKNKRKTVYISILIGIGLVIVVIAYLLFRQGKLRAATNLKLQEQNKIISEKKLEIEQSIEYAKGIQTAFLPGKDELSLVLKDNFILYKPKDVVSGDFYWYLISDDQKSVLLACADCTGHGVPGALMSMVGINILQQLTVERKMRSPGLILKYLNAEIKNSLKQNTDQNKQRDGMDIALIYIDIVKQKLIYSGANRPLYMVRNGELVEHKATKHAIGGYTKYDQTFEELKIDLQKNDHIYLTTDGYADQFGKEGKKFMTKRLKELLAKNSQLNALEQMEELELVFNNWKGNQEQVDDVCVIGIKL